jgi:hypothetical protein
LPTELAEDSTRIHAEARGERCQELEEKAITAQCSLFFLVPFSFSIMFRFCRAGAADGSDGLKIESTNPTSYSMHRTKPQIPKVFVLFGFSHSCRIRLRLLCASRDRLLL